VVIVARTETGPVRPANQDACLALQVAVGDTDKAVHFGLLAVADGMGGGVAGDRASAMTLEALVDTALPGLGRCKGSDDFSKTSGLMLRSAVEVAHRRLRQAVDMDPGLDGMGTTLTVALVGAGSVSLAQVGDSRCYRLRGRKLEPLTQDHSVVGELVREGLLTSEAARTHPRRNVITRAIGISDSVDADLSVLDIAPDDLLLICSDGLWEAIPETWLSALLVDEMAALRQSRLDEGSGDEPHTVKATGTVAAALRSAAWSLIQAAIAGGGTDNITVVLGLIEPADLEVVDTIPHGLSRTLVEAGAPEPVDLRQTLKQKLQEWRDECPLPESR
jgi:protein phosphatase